MGQNEILRFTRFPFKPKLEPIKTSKTYITSQNDRVGMLVKSREAVVGGF